MPRHSVLCGNTRGLWCITMTVVANMLLTSLLINDMGYCIFYYAQWFKKFKSLETKIPQECIYNYTHSNKIETAFESYATSPIIIPQCNALQ